jgi:PIN domain nuclease of toxin-antitoxin system
MYLLDTQVVIWVLTNPDKIPFRAREIIEDKANQIFFSNVSLFEIAIKQAIGKIPEFTEKTSQIIEQLKLQAIFLKPLSVDSIENYEQIPVFAQHRDPFDRMLLSISFTENIPIISSDEKFSLYSDFVHVVWK